MCILWYIEEWFLKCLQFQILTHFARPDWAKLLAEVLQKHPNTRIGWSTCNSCSNFTVVYAKKDTLICAAGVFACGPAALLGELRKVCHDLSVTSRNGSNFVFRKEKF